VQKKLRELIEEAIKSYQAKAGTAIIMDPKNGEVLAMVNSPTYDNNIFNKEDDKAINQVLNDPRALLVNQSVSGMYAPGSTVKMAIGAYALEKGVVKNSTLISGDPQVIKIGGYEFPDWTYSWGRAPYGMMDLPKAIAVSSDTFFYKIGGGFPPECKVANIPCQINGLGVDGVVNALRLFGFGQTTNIDLPSEAAGLVPDPDWKESMKNEPWFLGNTYHLSIGQGDLLATPLQVINLSNIVATNSKTSIPHLVFDADLVEKYKLNQGKDKPVSLESIRVAREGMDEAVNGEGIVYSLRGGKVKVAAKTGTAEFGELNAKGEYATHAWVTGFAPVDNPTISFVFMLDTGGKSSNAADVARKFIDWFYSRS
jgi:penicillin-binding protein 2